jgi:hypothetical protein
MHDFFPRISEMKPDFIRTVMREITNSPEPCRIFVGFWLESSSGKKQEYSYDVPTRSLPGAVLLTKNSQNVDCHTQIVILNKIKSNTS